MSSKVQKVTHATWNAWFVNIDYRETGSTSQLNHRLFQIEYEIQIYLYERKCHVIVVHGLSDHILRWAILDLTSILPSFLFFWGIHMLKYWCQIWPKHNFMHQKESNSMEKLFNTLKLVILHLKWMIYSIKNFINKTHYYMKRELRNNSFLSFCLECLEVGCLFFDSRMGVLFIKKIY